AAESLLLKHTLRPARSSLHTASKLRSSQVHISGSPRCGVTPSATHSLTITSSGSPAGPVCASIRLTRSTRAASPMTCSTSGMTARTSGVSSSSRLAFAEAANRLSRRSRESLIWLSSSAHEDTGSSGSRSAAASEATGPWAGLRKSAPGPGLRKSAPGPGCFRKSGAESADGPSAGLRMSEVSSRRSGVRVAFMHSPSAASRLSVTRGGRTLPATTQGFVDRDQASHGVGSADCKLVLSLELSPFRIKDFQKVDNPALIPGPRQAGRRGARPGGVVGVPQVVACTGMSYQGILGVLEGQKHRFLVGGQLYIRLSMGGPHLSGDPAEVEGCP